ncbi:MAG: hypothetical protein H6620_11880 [Halobacteriovoraceae bacterium]|nr:hypothetical protein [Halobacteriovoraceae bacterium]
MSIASIQKSHSILFSECSELVKKSQLLTSINDDGSARIFLDIQNSIDKIVNTIEHVISLQKNHIENEKKNITQTEQKNVLINQNLKKSKKRLEDLEAKRDGLVRKMGDIENIIMELGKAIELFEEKKRESEKGKNAGIGLIVGGIIFAPLTLGLSLSITIGGGVLTGLSVKDIEEAERNISKFRLEKDNLSCELRLCEEEIKKEKVLVLDIENQILRFNKERSDIDILIQNLGKDLTFSHQLKEKMHDLKRRYIFLHNGIKDIKDCLDFDLKDESLVSDFIVNIQHLEKTCISSLVYTS